MKVIIAGCRDYTKMSGLEVAVDKAGFPMTEIVCGGAKGADELGRIYAREWAIPVKMFNADWQKHGKAAGPIRNEEMAKYGDALIALWDGKSRGTQNMIWRARSIHELPTFIYRFDEEGS